MTGIELIAAERERQVSQEGWTLEHDDGHDGGELIVEAGRWALEGTTHAIPGDGLCGTAEKRRSKSRLRRLAIAGALIAAEIDRLQRAKYAAPTQTATDHCTPGHLVADVLGGNDAAATAGEGTDAEQP